jgi:hypothetical protein
MSTDMRKTAELVGHNGSIEQSKLVYSSFPDEVWNEIMQWISDQDISAWCMTCKLFKELLKHWKTWRFFKTFGYHCNPRVRYQDICPELVTVSDGFRRIISILSTPCIFGIEFCNDIRRYPSHGYTDFCSKIRYVAYQLMSIFEFYKVSYKKKNNFMKRFYDRVNTLFIGVTHEAVKSMTHKTQLKGWGKHRVVALKTNLQRYMFHVLIKDGCVKILCNQMIGKQINKCNLVGHVSTADFFDQW